MLPDAGRVAVFAPRPGTDLSALRGLSVQVITGFRPDHDRFTGKGVDCALAPEGHYAVSVVFLPRAKGLAHNLIAAAAATTDGPVIVDGAKTDGVESVLKACRQRADVSQPLSKAHGKLFWFDAASGFEDWAAPGPQKIEGGFVTLPGVFSSDGVDPASALLADHLPVKLGARIADLGAGWGYLGARILERDCVEYLHLVEADHAALECARQNVQDPRAHMHWDDATRWTPPEPLDTVVTNPPFHQSRAIDPTLGQAFIRTAARILKPRGQLFLVANRHLPYEPHMTALFAETREIGGDNRFKILQGSRPTRKPG